jgi:hypothetical protein
MTHCFARSSLQNVVLLKKNHTYDQIDMEELHKNMLNNYISDVRVERHIFNDITELFSVRYSSLNI